MFHRRVTYLLVIAGATVGILGIILFEVPTLSAQSLHDIADQFDVTLGEGTGTTVAAAGPPEPEQSDQSDPATQKAIHKARSVLDTAGKNSVDAIGCPLLTKGIPAARQLWNDNQDREAYRLLTRAISRGSLKCPDQVYPTVDTSIDWATSLDAPAESDSDSGSGKSTEDQTFFWDVPSSSRPLRDRARVLRARILLDSPYDSPKEALEDLEAVGDSTPIGDYILHLKARAHQRLHQHERAAKQLAKLVEKYPTSSLRWKAKTKEAFLRVEADQPRRAIRIIDRLLKLFPDHPRRFRLLYYRAVSYQMAGNLRLAARSFQQTWLAFPHKPEGELALSRLEQLERFGIRVRDIPDARLLDRYRDLRTNKHWELAGTLLRKLLDSVETESGHSAIEHRIWFELGMNAYAPQYFELALPWFEKLRQAYNEGHTKGIEPNVVDKYLERTYGKLGRVQDAIDALERRLASSSEYVRTREKAELLEDFTRYEEAYRLVDAIFSEWAKRRWQYTWLLYKTGRLKRAEKNFRAMVARRHGTGEQQARYWLGRTLGRLGESQNARNVYLTAVRDDADDYYGIQAASRLIDMKRREAVSDAVTQRTREVVGGSDEVLAALETAGDVMEDGSPRTPAADETLVPRSGGVFSSSPDQRSLSARECRTGSDAQRRRCHLAAGNTPPEMRSMVDRLLHPRRGLFGMTFGSMSGLVISDALRRDQPGPHGDMGRTNKFGTTTSRKDDLSAKGVIARARMRALNTAAKSAHRINWHTPAHLFWNGRAGGPPSDGEVPGPVPSRTTAYGGAAPRGAMAETVAAAGKLFPALRRAEWLHSLDFEVGARKAARQAVLEFRAVTDGDWPKKGEPLELEHRRWAYLIDHRPYQQGYWSYTGDEVRRYPVPESDSGKKALVARQRTIHRNERRLRSLLIDSMTEIGDFHMVRQLVSTRHSRWYVTSPSGDARKIWKKMHPRAFAELVLPAAKAENLNPYLVWSLMGVESAFNPDSISRAEAIGLLQVIPRTGIKVAAWLGDEDFGPYDLVEAPTAVRHGTSYFGSLVEKFRGQMLLAIIGYNAGPHRVAQWLKQRGRQPMDEFIEEVPFNQARGYVRKVTGYLKTYLTVYEGTRDLYIGQQLDRNARFYPNF